MEISVTLIHDSITGIANTMLFFFYINKSKEKLIPAIDQ